MGGEKKKRSLPSPGRRSWATPSVCLGSAFHDWTKADPARGPRALRAPYPCTGPARVPPRIWTSEILRSQGVRNVPRPGSRRVPCRRQLPRRGLGPSPTPRTGRPSGPERSPTFDAEAKGSRRERCSVAAASLRERGRGARRRTARRAAVPWSATSLRKLELRGHAAQPPA